MSRVLRVGGRIAVHDFDGESLFCDSPFENATRKIALSFCDGMKNGWIGRCLPRLFREVGMTELSVAYRYITVTIFFYFCWADMLPGRRRAVAFSLSVCNAKRNDRKKVDTPITVALRALVSRTWDFTANTLPCSLRIRSFLP